MPIYEMSKPTLTQICTDSQSAFESLPINLTSRCGKVIGKSLK